MGSRKTAGTAGGVCSGAPADKQALGCEWESCCGRGESSSLAVPTLSGLSA